MQAALFATVAIAWGLTWYAIRLQLGATPETVSIFWRFFLAAALVWLILLSTRQAKAARPRQHLWFAAMGLTLFSGNFLLIYAAERFLPSGVVAVVFSLASVFNACNQWLFCRQRPGVRLLVGAALGTIGVALLFADELAAPGGAHFLRGLALALAGTYSFSLGNLLSQKVSRAGHTTLPNAIARGMSWGVLFLAAAVLAQGHRFAVPLTAAYLGGLAYLVLFGSVIGFFAYLSLVARVGPPRAAYATVIAPVIALAVSSLLEGYVWHWPALLGVVCVLAGNVVLFGRLAASRLRRLPPTACPQPSLVLECSRQPQEPP